MKVVIIGSGNVATILGRKILAAGHEIVQVVGRNAKNAYDLSSFLNAGYTTNLVEISLLANIYIISVSDLAISVIASQLRLNDRIVVHTAAAVSKEVLAQCSTNYGVLYPLQSLQKQVAAIPGIPVLIDANNAVAKDKLKEFATSWADNVSLAGDEERLKLHLAAVFVNNFTNHLFSVTQAFCNNNHLNFNNLLPIIEETIVRIKDNPAALIQTGPARRKDSETIEKHQHLMEQSPLALNLYNVLTKSIMDFYDGNNI